jgi:tetratricopeptide (TPR) repeat protein
VSEERTFGNMRQTLLMAGASGAAECGIACSWLIGGMPVWAALLGHTVVSTCVAAWCCRSEKARADIRLPFLLALSTAALGPIGVAGTILAALLARRSLRRGHSFEEWYQSIFPEAEEIANIRLVDRIEGEDPAGADEVASFPDVLSFGSLRQKQDLIAFISRNFRPVFGPILKRALHDPESVIRVQAATAMSKLESSIAARTLALKERVRRNPEDTATLRALALHYDTWLFSGILDPKREQDILAAALGLYEKCRAAEPGNSETQLMAGRLFLRCKRYREASECFHEILDAPVTASRAALWQMETLFHSGNFEEVRRLAHATQPRLEPAGGYSPEALDSIRLWAEPVSSPPGES